MEYAIKTHEQFKSWFGKWLKFHIALSVVLYALMALHIWAAVHFGLRWFDGSASSTSYFTPTAPAAGGTSLQFNMSANAIETRSSSAAVDQFSSSFQRMFRQNWRAPVLIHGTKTTVFDYARISNEVGRPESDFSQAERALERVDVAHLGGGDREKAFWINVYNFGAMKLVAENYPVTSITDKKISDGDPWSAPAIRVGTEQYALHQIENDILLKKFDDPRIVFAINCAAVSCPDRTNDILSTDKIDQQLDEIVRGLFANSTKGLAIDERRNVIELSWILKADRRLFGDGSDDSLLEFVREYAPAKVRDWIDADRSNIKIEFFEHDWSLNDMALAQRKIGRYGLPIRWTSGRATYRGRRIGVTI